MNDLLCFEKAGAYVRARLAEPGMLRGRQRGETFGDQAVTFMVYLLGKHARAEHEHVFPLSRMPMGGLDGLGLSEWTIRRLIPVLTRAGFIEPVNSLKRRYETGTVSPTEGAKGSWWFPRLFKLSDTLRAFFGRTAKSDLDPVPLENQCAQDETLNVEEEGTLPNKGYNSGESHVLVALTGLDYEDEDDGLMDALETFRQVVVPNARPVRAKVEADPPAPRGWRPTAQEMREIMRERPDPAACRFTDRRGFLDIMKRPIGSAW